MCDERELSRYLERKILDLIHQVEIQKIQCARIEDVVNHMKKEGSSEDDPEEKVDRILRSVEKRNNPPVIKYQDEERRKRSASQP